ncbi:MAG: hypothetical protein AB7H90_00940 [Alphaproteobacteria bacterium]
MTDAAADEARLKRQGLFPCEAEIARRLSQSGKRWREIARQLEKEGLPKIDPLMGGRFWPAVVTFFARRYGIIPEAERRAIIVSAGEDGEEHWDAA